MKGRPEDLPCRVLARGPAKVSLPLETLLHDSEEHVTFMRFCVYKSTANETKQPKEQGSLLPPRKARREEALQGPVCSHTHVDFLLKTLMHLLQLQLMLAAQLGLIPMFFFLEQPKLSELLAPAGLKDADIPVRKWPASETT